MSLEGTLGMQSKVMTGETENVSVSLLSTVYSSTDPAVDSFRKVLILARVLSFSWGNDDPKVDPLA